MDKVKRHDPLDISVLVCGAGVAGLMTALECWRRGFNVKILERAPHNSTAGDSFMIGPTAINSFKHWPWMQKRNGEISYDPLVAYHKITGERISGPMSFNELMSKSLTEEEKPQKMHRHSRPKFHRMLLDQLFDVGLNVEYGKEAINYSEDVERGSGRVELIDGSVQEADIVVAADGIKGKSWPLVVGHLSSARSTGDALFRVAYPVEYAMQDPILAERFPLAEDGRSIIEMWIGPGVHAAFWRTRDEMSIGIQHPDHGTAEESWSHRVSPDEILKYTGTISGWPEVGDRVIRAIPADEVMDFKVMWRDPQPTWTSPGGRIIQVGDAAHTLLPSSGNGATQAIEDAVSLAACISMAGAKQNLPDAARVHNLLRFERVSCLQAFGVVNRKKNTSNADKNDKSKKHQAMIPKWIINHDPESYALQNYVHALSHLTDGTTFVNTNIPPGLTYIPWTIDDLLLSHEKGEPSVLDGDWT